MARLTPEQIKASFWEARFIAGSSPAGRFARRMGKTAEINEVDLDEEEEGRERGSGVVGEGSKRFARGTR